MNIKKFLINTLNKSDRNINQTQENLKQKQYNDNIENKEKINEIIDALGVVDSSIDTINNDISDINASLGTKVNKSGDTMTGTLKVPQLAANCNYDTNKGGAIQSNGNLNFMGSSDSINWKEVGYGDKFRIVPSFGGADDSNILQIQGTVGGAGEDPTSYKNLITVSGKSGNADIAGSLKVGSFAKNTTDTWIPVINGGKFDYTLRAIWNSKQHTNYNTNQEYLVTLSVLSWWNGAYSSGNNSNLTYCHQGTIQAKPISLYDNSSGSNGSITLSQSAANFTFLEIYCKTNDGQYTSTRVYSPNGKNVNIIGAYPFSANYSYIKPKTVSISGTSISNYNTQYGQIWVNTSGSALASNSNNIYITKVWGYK